MKNMVLLLFFFISSLSGSTVEIKMLSELLNSFERPLSLFTKVCWNPSMKLHYMSTLGNLEEKPKVNRFIDANTINKHNDYLNRHFIIFIVDINCPRIEYFFKKANIAKKFGLPYKWVIIGKSLNKDGTVPREMYELDILPDSEVIIAQNNGSDSFKLSMIYRIRPQSEWIIENYGEWTSLSGLKKVKLTEQSISIRRKNFHRTPIKITLVIFNNKTKEDLFDLSDFFTDTATKANYRQVYPLFTYLNASIEFIYTDNWGYYRNGSFNGMIGELTNERAELAGTVLIITLQRIKVVDFLISPSPISLKFVFREPPLSYQNNLFLLPFKSTVWYCIGAFVIILIFIIYINALWEKKKMVDNESKKIEHVYLRPNVSDVTMLVVTAIAQQGSSLELKGGLGRLVTFLLFLVFLLLYSSYSASIVALLQSRSNQIRTLADLLNSKLELGVENTPYNKHYFSAATEPIRKAIYQKKIAPPGAKPKFMDLEEGVKKLQKEPFAFHMATEFGYHVVHRYFYEHEKCGLQEIQYLDNTKTYLTCQRNTPYKEFFKVGLLRIKETGIGDRENRYFFSRRPVCLARGGSFQSVNMIDFYPVMLLLIYGMILSFAIMIIEILLHRRQMLKNNVF